MRDAPSAQGVQERGVRRRRAFAATPFVVLTSLMLLASGAHGLIIHTSHTLNSASALLVISDFGFKAGGEVRVNVDIWTGGVQSYVASCAKTVVQSLPSSESGLEAYCSGWLSSQTQRDANCFVELGLGVGEHRFTFSSQTYSRTAVVLCRQNDAATFRATSTFLNPGGEHLGTEYIPAKMTYLVFIVLWLAVAAYTAIVYWKRRREATWIHVLVLVAIVCRLAWLCVAYAFWMRASASSEGIPLIDKQFYAPRDSSIGSLSYIVVLALNQATIFLILCLISRGWLITLRHLTTVDVFLISNWVFGLFVFNVVCRALSTNLLRIGLFLYYPAVCAYIIATCGSNLKKLRLQSYIVLNARVPVDETAVYAKESIFRSVQLLMFAYITAKIIMNLIDLFLNGSDWIRYVLGESLDLLASLALGRIIRPRLISNPFNTHVVGDFSSLFNGSVHSMNERIAALGLGANQIPPPLFYVVEVGGEGASLRERLKFVGTGIGCLRLILVEHPSTHDDILKNLSIALPDPETRS